ncbi:MAG: RDD family protein, partial [Planctomycetes bacterium]|nr:RDD family protein [Planctomycetota bacterium]
AADPRGPLLVVSRASALECYVREGEAWRRVEVLGSGGPPGGLGAGSWLLVSVGALVVLGSAGALLFVRAGPVGEGGLGSEVGYASVMERGAAYAFDVILAFFVVLVLSGSYEPAATVIITVVSHLLYGTALEAYWGRTLGKRLVGIVVVTPGLEVIGPGRSLLRNLVRLVDSAPVYLIGLISIGLSGRRQRVGDRLAGTVVLRESALMVPRVGTVPGVSPTGDAEAEG